MKPIPISELTAMRVEVADSFNCTCKIGAVTVSTDTLGDIISTPTWGSEISAGLTLVGGKELTAGNLSELPFDATLRLPLGTTITPTSKVTVTKLWGTTVNLVFSVISEPHIGATAIVVDLKRVSL